MTRRQPRYGSAVAPWLVALGALLAVVVDCAHAQQPITALAPVEIYADGFSDLRGLAVDEAGHVFVADGEAGTVTRIAPDLTQTIVASGLERPIGLAFDAQGHLLIAEERAGRVACNRGGVGCQPISRALGEA